MNKLNTPTNGLKASKSMEKMKINDQRITIMNTYREELR